MRVYNFAPGPASLPVEVLERAQSELVEHGNDGMSVMEMSHRSKMYQTIIDSAEASLRRVMGIPDGYKVLFLQGGATLQFAMVPMNLMKCGRADYVVTGSFASKAQQEAMKYGESRVVASSADRNYSYIPALTRSMFNPGADYVHITTNNTIYGTSFRNNLPDVAGIPLVADMSSNILSEPMDVSRFALIYAGAQKNIGPAGLTIVIIREDLLRADLPSYVPTMLNYRVAADNGSMYNTPPTFGIYMAGLVFEYIEKNGGVKAMGERNEHKAALLYDFLDNSKLFKPTAEKESRSIMNVTFLLPTEELNDAFVKGAAKNGLVNLKGHRSVGGMRASIYNAVTIEGVKALVEYMKKFETENA